MIKQTGFTMVELLVVMFIISLLTVGVLLSYRGSSKNYALDQAIQKLISDLRRVQNMALSGVDKSSYPGYGLFAAENASVYFIYGDTNANHTYQLNDDIIETIVLGNNLIIDDTSPIAWIDIFFESPNPTTYINGNNGVGVLGTITLGIDGSPRTEIVTITTAGLIQGN